MKRSEVIAQFQGLDTESPKVRLPDGKFSADVGGERFTVGRWRRRRGMRHTDIASKGSAITTILGFEITGSDFAVLLTESTNAWGFTNVSQQDWTAGGGYGESEYGEEEAGE